MFTPASEDWPFFAGQRGEFACLDRTRCTQTPSELLLVNPSPVIDLGPTTASLD